MVIHKWLFQTCIFRENLKIGEGGRADDDDRIVAATVRRTGASLTGKRMFEEGEHTWPEEAPFHTPVFVLTYETRKA